MFVEERKTISRRKLVETLLRACKHGKMEMAEFLLMLLNASNKFSAEDVSESDLIYVIEGADRRGDVRTCVDFMMPLLTDSKRKKGILRLLFTQTYYYTNLQSRRDAMTVQTRQIHRRRSDERSVWFRENIFSVHRPEQKGYCSA